jgi:hypothetical protein
VLLPASRGIENSVDLPNPLGQRLI